MAQLLKKSVLIVEDDVLVLGVLHKIITMRFPCIVIHLANDGISGLASFTLHKPDIIITDIGMPELDGLSMATKIKSFNPEAVIIAVTGHSTEEHLKYAAEIGIGHYLKKPISIKELFNCLDVLDTLSPTLNAAYQHETPI